VITQFNTLLDLMNAFPDEQSCIDQLTSIRWRDGEFCPYCGSTKVYHFSDRKTHKCGDCKSRFSIKVGTIFEDTKLPLRKWFIAMWMITSHKKGIASVQLAKDLGITQKSAWFVLHRLRHAARTQSFNAPLEGVNEMDSTFVGGLEKNKHASKRTGGTQGGAGKAVVLGIKNRDGELRLQVVKAENTRIVRAIVDANIAKGAVIMTDEAKAYTGLARDYFHHTVNHSAGEYVRHYTIHTNGIESVWALLKRQIIGIHHWVSPKHLSRYVDEMSWRQNRRDMAEGVRMNDMFACVEGRLTYKALIA
jgi:transposase-like protein